ncbi:hypothetical protein [Streptomyces antibioticus]|uniref:hypothetical protein n=1 Tax=Streptomyces antibioticus TaxID=1890 RepID=UPI001FD82DE7|nr:hypothetical protein [Streptomyces antibioticus]
MAEIPMNAFTASRSAEPTRLPFTKRQMMFAVFFAPYRLNSATARTTLMLDPAGAKEIRTAATAAPH